MNQTNQINQINQINEMDEIDLWAYLEILWKRKVLVLSITLLCAISAIIISFVLPKSYRSEIILKVGTIGTESVVSTVIDDVNNVAVLIKSKPFLATVIQKNGFKRKHLTVNAFIEKYPLNQCSGRG